MARLGVTVEWAGDSFSIDLEDPEGIRNVGQADGQVRACIGAAQCLLLACGGWSLSGDDGATETSHCVLPNAALQELDVLRNLATALVPRDDLPAEVTRAVSEAMAKIEKIREGRGNGK